MNESRLFVTLKCRRLVRCIAKEIIQQRGYYLYIRPAFTDPTNQKACENIHLLYCADGLCETSEHQTPISILFGEILDAIREKIAHLEPEVLGQIISTGAGKNAKVKRTKISAVESVSSSISDDLNGTDILKGIAITILVAACWDLLLKDARQVALTDEQITDQIEDLISGTKH